MSQHENLVDFEKFDPYAQRTYIDLIRKVVITPFQQVKMYIEVRFEVCLLYLSGGVSNFLNYHSKLNLSRRVLIGTHITGV